MVNRDFLFVLGAFGLPSIDRRAALAGIAAFSTLSTCPAVAQDPPKRLRHWGGINHGTGFFPDEPFLSACIAAGRQLGLMAARTRMNTVGGRQVGAPWTWERRDRAFERYRAAGFQLHCILSFREFVDHGMGADWERNWRAFVRAAMARYRDQVEIWIIDNEPENRLADSRPTPAQCVAFTRIAWEELHDLGIEDRCRIESPPVKAVDSPFLGAMLDAGLAHLAEKAPELHAMVQAHDLEEKPMPVVLAELSVPMPELGRAADERPRLGGCGGHPCPRAARIPCAFAVDYEK